MYLIILTGSSFGLQLLNNAVVPSETESVQQLQPNDEDPEAAKLITMRTIMGSEPLGKKSRNYIERERSILVFYRVQDNT